MSVVMRVATLVLMSIVPGGLLVLAAWVIAHLVVERMRTQQGSSSRRFASAVRTISWHDVKSETRRLV